jgi:hypothetical protein
VEVGFQDAELFVPAFEEVSQWEDGEVVDLGTAGWTGRFLLPVRLLAGDSPFQTVETFFGNATRAKIYPGDLSQEEGKLGSLGTVWEEDWNNRQLSPHHLCQASPHLGEFPGTEPIFAYQDGGGADGGDDLLDGLLPRTTRDQLPFVQPHLKPTVPQGFTDLAHGRLVLAVMAEEDVEGLGQGRPPGSGCLAVYQALWQPRLNRRGLDTVSVETSLPVSG